MCAPIYCEFQFTPLREGRREWRYSHGACDDFNSRPSARGDGQVSVTNLSPNHFNSRPSARGDLMRVMTLAIFLHFNSRPSARGDARLVEKRIHEGQISIHAPPRGATLDGVHRVLILLFQFTPLREGRPAPPPNRRSAAYFNSRPSARGDVVLCRYEFAPDNFNSRPSARGDGTSTSLYPRGLFQFTPLREGRRWRDGNVSARRISIHAPPRGATQPTNALASSVSISIHAPPRGATLIGTKQATFTLFQFTPLREGRRQLRTRHVLYAISIHAPPRGATTPARRAPHRCYFNSRPSARGDGH